MPLNEKDKEELLDCVSACQSAYHIQSTPGHRFAHLGDELDDNRQAVVDHVESLLDPACASAPTIPEPLKIGEWIEGYEGAIALKDRNGNWSISHSNNVDPSSKWTGPKGKVQTGPEMMLSSGYVGWLPLDKMPVPA